MTSRRINAAVEFRHRGASKVEMSRKPYKTCRFQHTLLNCTFRGRMFCAGVAEEYSACAERMRLESRVLQSFEACTPWCTEHVQYTRSHACVRVGVHRRTMKTENV